MPRHSLASKPSATSLHRAVCEFLARLEILYKGDAGVGTVGCADLFRVIAFAQLTRRESLRNIEACLTGLKCAALHAPS